MYSYTSICFKVFNSLKVPMHAYVNVCMHGHKLLYTSNRATLYYLVLCGVMNVCIMLKCMFVSWWSVTNWYGYGYIVYTDSTVKGRRGAVGCKSDS